jgi:hypothetical protein
MKTLTSALILAASLACCGCVASAPNRTYTVTQPWTLHVVDAATIEDIGGLGVRGANLAGCVLFVPKSGLTDAHGNALPDFGVLGHEVWHLRQLGGNDWH